MRAGRKVCRSWASGALTFPDATSTGARGPAPVTTFNVPADGTSGTGWSWSGSACTVTGSVSGLNVAGTIIVAGTGATVSSCAAAGNGINIAASGVTVSGCAAPSVAITTSGLAGIMIEGCVIAQDATGSGEGVKLNAVTGAAGLTIQDCTISGGDSGPNRIPYGIDDNEGNTTGLLIQRCDISWCRIGISVTSGTLRDNYIHDFGFVADDHTDGIANGGTGGAVLQIIRNTILLAQGATSPLPLGGNSASLQNVLVAGNLLAGGGYCIYAGLEGGDNLRTDTGCTISGGTTLTDASLSAGDAGVTVTGTGIPPFTTIGAPSGTTATLSQACTSGTVDVDVHSSLNIVITGNRYSAMFFQNGGLFATNTDLDGAVASNVYAGNCIHDTGAPG